MNRETGIDPVWEDKVAAEAMNFVNAVQQNFLHGLKTSLQYLPVQDAKHKSIQLDYFIDAMVGVCVERIATFATTDKRMEELVLLAVQQKFDYIRGELAKRKIRDDLAQTSTPEIITPDSPEGA